ncbi:MAG: aldose epimerase family protein [Spirochaetales bacterium]
MKVSSSEFGRIDGSPVTRFTVSNVAGYSITCMDYGATLIDVKAPDRDGRVETITLGYDDFEPYAAGHPFFGSTVGRVANRIGGARFSLNGATITVDQNEGANTLHGGAGGFHTKMWSAAPFERDTLAGVFFHLESPAGDQGFPGNVGVTVSICLTEENEIVFEYRAESDEPTPLNLTNHSYWNLLGAPDLVRAAGSAKLAPPEKGGAIADHELVIYGSHYIYVDDASIPTGEIPEVRGTGYDFTGKCTIGERIEQVGGYDLSYVLQNAEHELRRAASAYHPESGRSMEVLTTCPAVQFYTGEKLSGVPGRGGQRLEKRDAFCLETQYHPDAVNHEHFPSIIIEPEEVYQEKTIHRFSVS